MTVFRLLVAGDIKKVEMRRAGDKDLAEVSVCKKNRTKEGEEESYTWAKLSIWSPPDWMKAKLVKGNFISGSGEFTLRSYEKDGVKRQSAECNCQSFDVEISAAFPRLGESHPPVATPVKPAPKAAPIGGGKGDDEPPFAPYQPWSWG